MTAREREHKHTLGRTSAGHSPQRRIRSQRSSSIYIADFYLRVTSPSARVLDQPVCNKASPKVGDASPKNVQEWCSPSCWPRIDFGPLYLKSEYMISPVHLPIKLHLPALCCGPDMRTCADVLERIHTNKNVNDRKRGGSVS